MSKDRSLLDEAMQKFRNGKYRRNFIEVVGEVDKHDYISIICVLERKEHERYWDAIVNHLKDLNIKAVQQEGLTFIFLFNSLISDPIAESAVSWRETYLDDRIVFEAYIERNVAKRVFEWAEANGRTTTVDGQKAIKTWGFVTAMVNMDTTGYSEEQTIYTNYKIADMAPIALPLSETRLIISKITHEHLAFFVVDKLASSDKTTSLLLQSSMNYLRENVKFIAVAQSYITPDAQLLEGLLTFTYRLSRVDQRLYLSFKSIKARIASGKHRIGFNVQAEVKYEIDLSKKSLFDKVIMTSPNENIQQTVKQELENMRQDIGQDVGQDVGQDMEQGIVSDINETTDEMIKLLEEFNQRNKKRRLN